MSVQTPQNRLALFVLLLACMLTASCHAGRPPERLYGKWRFDTEKQFAQQKVQNPVMQRFMAEATFEIAPDHATIVFGGAPNRMGFKLLDSSGDTWHAETSEKQGAPQAITIQWQDDDHLQIINPKTTLNLVRAK